MPNVKIELLKGETPESAEDLLFKAFLSQRDGSQHDGSFHDLAMEDLSIRLQKMHEDEYKSMLQEVFEAIDKEYSDDGNF